MRTFLRNLLSVISCLFLLLAMICLSLIVLGYRPFILDSASMEPLYKKGSFVLADTRISADDVQTGDVLIYRSESGTLVMHRLIAKNTFMGDANQTREYVDLTDANLVGSVSVALDNPLFAFLVRHEMLCFGLALILLILSCFPWPSSLQKEKPGGNTAGI